MLIKSVEEGCGGASGPSPQTVNSQCSGLSKLVYSECLWLSTGKGIVHMRQRKIIWKPSLNNLAIFPHSQAPFSQYQGCIRVFSSHHLVFIPLASGNTIRLYSQPSKPTEFSFSLPILLFLSCSQTGREILFPRGDKSWLCCCWSSKTEIMPSSPPPATGTLLWSQPVLNKYYKML